MNKKYSEVIFTINEASKETGRSFNEKNANVILTQLQDEIKQGRALCDTVNSHYSTIQLLKVATQITKAEIMANDLIIEYRVMDTPEGKDIQELLDDGLKIRHILCYNADLNDDQSLKEVTKFSKFMVGVDDRKY